MQFRLSRLLIGVILFSLVLGFGLRAGTLGVVIGIVHVFVVLLFWLATVGLPTAAAVVLLAWLWVGPSFQAYLLAAALLALFFQLGAVLGARWAIDRWRERTAR